MKFEEALAQMRLGKKITNPYLGETGEDDVYLMVCRVSLLGDDTPINERPLSIVKMKGEYQHPDMGTGKNIDDDFIPGTFIFKEEAAKRIFEKPCKHGYFPQLNLLLIMRDDWEVIE